MSKRIKYWLDSGANIHSKREGETTTDELGVTDDEWDAMSDDEREALVKECAFEQSEWGFYVVDEG